MQGGSILIFNAWCFDGGVCLYISCLCGSQLGSAFCHWPSLAASQQEFFHEWLRSLVDPVTRLVEENPRVGWKIHEWGKGKARGKRTGNY